MDETLYQEMILSSFLLDERTLVTCVDGFSGGTDTSTGILDSRHRETYLLRPNPIMDDIAPPWAKYRNEF